MLLPSAPVLTGERAADGGEEREDAVGVGRGTCVTSVPQPASPQDTEGTRAGGRAGWQRMFPTPALTLKAAAHPKRYWLQTSHVTNALTDSHCNMTRASHFPDGPGHCPHGQEAAQTEREAGNQHEAAPRPGGGQSCPGGCPTLALCLTSLVLDSPPSGQGVLSGRAEGLPGTSGAQARLPSTLSPSLSRELLRGRAPVACRSFARENPPPSRWPARRDLGS